MTRLAIGRRWKKPVFVLVIALLLSCVVWTTLIDGDSLQMAVMRGDTTRVRLCLLVKPGLARFRTFHNYTPLHWAAMDGDTEIARLLIAKGANVNAVSEEGVSALFLAAQRGRTDVVRLLLDHGAGISNAASFSGDIYPRTPDDSNSIKGYTPLHIASRNGHVRAMELLLDAGANPNQIADEDDPLLLAARNGGPEAVRCLLKRGAKLHQFYRTDIPLLSFAADAATVQALLDSGCKVDDPHTSAVSSLHDAAWKGDAGIARLLIEHGADPNEADQDKSTPLHAAATSQFGSTDRGGAEVAEVLIAYGARLDLRDRDGRTPLDIAISEARKRVVKVLTEHGAPATDRLSLAAAIGDNKGLAAMLATGRVSPDAALTALVAAAGNGSPNAVKTLLPTVNGADLRPVLKASIYSGSYEAFLLIYPLAHNANPQDELVRAAQWGRIEIADFLLKHGARLNAPASDPELDYENPLFGAIMGHSLPMVELLLSRGVGTGYIDGKGFPVRLAFVMGGKDREKIALELLHHGAQANPTWEDQTELRDMVTNPEPGEIRFVADHCTNINATTNYGATALDAAHDPETIRILLEHGARPGPGLPQGPSFLDRIRAFLSRLLHP